MSVDAEKEFAKLTQAMLKLPNTTLGQGKGGFGDGALQVNGKIFAMLTAKGEFSVKLPRQRVAGLVESGDGACLSMGARQMKEWFVVSRESALDWAAIATEAHRFVSGAPLTAP